MTRWLFAAGAALLLLTGRPARAEDWPQFRGPTGQGIVTDGPLPLTWGPMKNVTWKVPVPGKGWSSPVVCGGRVYLTTSVPVEGGAGDDQSLDALCLDAGSGKVVWQKEVIRQAGARAPRIHGKNSHASPTPLVHDGRLYVHFGHQGTACLDLAGTLLWKNTDLTYRPVHGNGGSPVLVDGLLVINCDGGDQAFVAALDAKTGKLRWKTDRKTDARKKFSFGTPLVITAAGKKQIVSPGSNLVAGYDPATGAEIWRVRYDGYSLVPRPVYGHGLLFVCTGYDSPVLLAIRPDGRGDVTKTHVAWTVRRAVALTPSLLLDGDELYMIADSGIACCLDARTGKEVWRQRLRGHYSASPVLADGKIYFQSEEGDTTVIRAGKEFKELAKNSLGERTLASFAAVKGVLFIRGEKHLFRIEAR